MPRITVERTKEDISEALAALDGIKNGFVRAYASALNKAATGTQTDMVAMARDDYTYKADAVRSRTEVVKATWTRLTSLVKSKGKGVPLTDFLGTRQTSTGLTVNIKRSTGLQYIRRAFIAPGKFSGKDLAFWRAEKWDVGSGRAASMTTELVGRLPIEALYGPHPEVVYNTDANWQKLQDSADERMTAAFANEIDYVLSQYGGT